MKNQNDLFQKAERLKPNPKLWKNIAAQVQLKSRSNGNHLWTTPFFRLAAGLVFAAGILAMVLSLQTRSKEMVMASVKLDSTHITEVDAVLDPEILVWEADLGEMEFLETNEIGAEESPEEVL